MPKSIRRVFSVAAAGEGTNGEEVLLTFGDERVLLVWLANRVNADGDPEPAWVDVREKDALRMAGNFGMGSAGNGFEGRSWDYLKFPEPGASRSFGWTPQKPRNVNLAWQAGLRLEEKVIRTFYAHDAADLFELGIVWYPFADGNNVSPLISPEDDGDARNVGTPVTSLVTERKFRGAWQPCPIYPVTEPQPILAPHPYVRSVKPSGSPNANAYLHRLNVRYRWVGIPA